MTLFRAASFPKVPRRGEKTDLFQSLSLPPARFYPVGAALLNNLSPLTLQLWLL